MELHDGVIQSLYAVGMFLELIRTSDSVKPEDLSEAIHSLDSVITDIRGYIQNLKARERQERSLEDSLRDMVKRLHVPTTLNVVIEPIHERVVLPPPIFEAVLQMVNEALSNVIRHADAQHVHISADQTGHSFVMTITDDGKGFDPGQTVSEEGGLGLRNMQQRALINGGDVTIESAPDAGTRVRLVMPV
jgi:signal transduction histidine kinase